MKKQSAIGLVASVCLFAGAIAISLPQADRSNTNHSQVQNAPHDLKPNTGDLRDPLMAVQPH